MIQYNYQIWKLNNYIEYSKLLLSYCNKTSLMTITKYETYDLLDLDPFSCDIMSKLIHELGSFNKLFNILTYIVNNKNKIEKYYQILEKYDNKNISMENNNSKKLRSENIITELKNLGVNYKSPDIYNRPSNAFSTIIFNLLDINEKQADLLELLLTKYSNPYIKTLNDPCFIKQKPFEKIIENSYFIYITGLIGNFISPLMLSHSIDKKDLSKYTNNIDIPPWGFRYLLKPVEFIGNKKKKENYTDLLIEELYGRIKDKNKKRMIFDPINNNINNYVGILEPYLNGGHLQYLISQSTDYSKIKTNIKEVSQELNRKCLIAKVVYCF